MILNDIQIAHLANDGMIRPFVNRKIKDGVISYGLSSYGYDIRLGSTFYDIVNHDNDLIDPKNTNNTNFVRRELDVMSDFVVLNPLSTILAVSLERIHMPSNVIALCVGKSTYARCGISILCTPIEPAWQGYITLEISNNTNSPVKLYKYEGIMQLIFFQGEKPLTHYNNGKYNNQLNDVTLAKVG